jgi:hypothetical protein
MREERAKQKLFYEISLKHFSDFIEFYDNIRIENYDNCNHKIFNNLEISIPQEIYDLHKY